MGKKILISYVCIECHKEKTLWLQEQTRLLVFIYNHRLKKRKGALGFCVGATNYGKVRRRNTW
jgi:hypothetical protein